MNTITSAGNNTTYTNNTSGGAASQAVSGEPSSSDNGDESAAASDDIQLSSRAQKIQKLNEEFFPSGPQSIRITSDFVARLHEYELISSEDAESISQGITQTKKDGTETNSLEELASFTQRLTEELEESDPGNSLINILKQAREIIEAWEGDNPKAMSAVTSVANTLENFKHSPAIEELSLSDQRHIMELELAMNVAQRMSPAPEMSGKINHYLDILNQSR